MCNAFFSKPHHNMQMVKGHTITDPMRTKSGTYVEIVNSRAQIFSQVQNHEMSEKTPK